MSTKPSTMNNVVPQKNLSAIQKNVLSLLSETLANSFGPNGSNSCIKLNGAMNQYTKDGHDILKNIHFHGVLEESIRDDIETITRHIVKTVGDGTTSAVLLSNHILNSIYDYIEKSKADGINVFPSDVIKTFTDVANKITDHIRSNAKDCTVDDIYDISMISTNGNEFISNMLRDIYAEHGMAVFIDVSAGTNEQTAIKSYDGVTLNTGFADPCYVTDTKRNECVVDNPSIYFFMDPIDTRGMMTLFDSILSNNIVMPFNILSKNPNTKVNLVPTVIIAPKISRDMSSLMKDTLNVMAALPAGQKLPLLIITDFYQNDMIEDLCKLTGAKPIMKYIDNKVYEEDVKLGRAPVPDTVTTFCGKAESVVANSNKTSFINPEKMHNPDGSYSQVYSGLINFLEKDLANAQANGEGPNVTGVLKRRIHALKSDLIEIIVGGIDQADRDALRALVEDAVLNCRSAAKNGVGYGANFMGLQASAAISTNDAKESAIRDYIYIAYKRLIERLYNRVPDSALTIEMIERGMPINIRTGKYDGKVLSSIESDIIVLNTVVKIVSLMATCNQYLTPTAIHNVYVD